MTDFTFADTRMMRRSIALAGKAGYRVRSNPQVGAVIAYNDKIIGEGYHKQFGGPHAEINALKDVAAEDRQYLQNSHLYVTLEPCNHHGKTPPCVDAILQAKIPKVTISNLDPTDKMNGKSVERLQSAGVEVRTGLLEKEGFDLIRKFTVYHKEQLPYIILKWAQSKDGYIGHQDMQVWLSNEQSRLMVHRWREECDAILVGTQTIITDNPSLTNRRGFGRSPARIILDRTGRIPRDAKVYTTEGEVHLFTTVEKIKGIPDQVIYNHIPQEEWSFEKIAKHVHQLGHTSLLIEGGAMLQSALIEQNMWHEGRVIHTDRRIYSGIRAPLISGKIKKKYTLVKDKILIFNNLKIDEKYM